MNKQLIAARELKGWTQANLAEKLEVTPLTISRWENGVQIPRTFMVMRLCRVFGMSAEALGLVCEKQDTEFRNTPQIVIASKLQAREENVSTIASLQEHIMKLKRRELLYLLSIAGSALLLPLPDIDWDRIERTLAKPSQLDKQAINDLTIINSSFWSLYRGSAAKFTVLDGVLGQLKTLIGFLKESHPALLHGQLCALASDLSQLAGEIFFDANDYSTAQSCYTFAAASAKEANQYDLWSCALVRSSFLPIYDERFHDALPLLHAARNIVSRGDTTLVTRFWIAAVEADAQAGVGNLSMCQQALDCAAEVCHVKGGSNGGWLRFDGDRLPEQRGACFVKLERPDLAIPTLLSSLDHLSTPTRRRGMVLNDLATALAQQGHIEQACIYADEVVGIATQAASGVLKKGIHSLRLQLESFANCSAVSNLDQKITLLA